VIDFRGASRSALRLLLPPAALLAQCALADSTEHEAPAKTGPASASPTRAVRPAPAAIPMAEVATRAAEIPHLLRTLSEPLAPSPQIETIRRIFPEVRERVRLETAATATVLGAEPTLDMLQAQQQLWQRRQLDLNGWLSTLTLRATQLQDTLGRLAMLKETWRRTREASARSQAPAAVLAQADETLTAIEAAEGPLMAQRTSVLDLQSLVAQEVTQAAATLAQLTQAQQRAIGGVFTRDSPPLWAARSWERAHESLWARLRAIVAVDQADLALYVRDPARGLPLHAFVLLGLTAVFVAARRHARRSPISASGASPVVTVFDRPYSAAFIVTLLLISAPISSVSPGLRNLFEVVMLAPLLRLTRPALDPRLQRPAYVFAILFALDSLRQAIGGVPVLEQALLGLEMVAGIAVLTFGLTLGHLQRPSGGSDTDRLDGIRVGVGLVLLVLAAGLVAGVLGYMQLARLVASALFGGSALALTLYACVQVAAGLAALALDVWPLRLLRMIQNHHGLLQRRVYRVLLWVAFGTWLVRVLDYAGLFEPAWALGRTLLTAPLGVNCQEIVRGHQATDGWSTAERPMAALPIVVVEPGRQRLGAVPRVRVGPAVGPLAQQGLDEALRLAIGARGVRAGAQMAHARTATEAGEPRRDIARAIVAQDAADADAVAAEPRPGAPEKLRRRGAILLRQHLDVGQPRGVVHRHVDVLPADAAHPTPTIPADAMAHPPNAAELLDVEVDQITGPRPLVALDGGRGLEGPQPGQPLAAQQPRDGGRTEVQGLGDRFPRPALPAQPLHPARQQGRRGPGTALRAARAIGQAGLGLAGIPSHPLAHGPLADPHRGGHGRRGLLLCQHAAHDLASTPGRRPGILMNVHPGLLLCGDGRLATTTVAETARMDNLLAVHT
jgi:hypothetical protein